jgi:PKD repeat protein
MPIITTVPTAIQPIQHLFTTGTNISIYTVTFIAINGCGSDTMTKQITVFPNNVDAFFTADTLSGCVPLTVNFSNTSIGNTSSSWSFGDGTYSNSSSPTHTFTQSGLFTVQLVASDSCAYDTASIDILVYPKPIIDFIYSDDTVCVNDIISFTNTSPNPLVNANWDFGDGNNATINNPTHSYTSSGTYVVSLSGNSVGYNCPNTTIKNVVVLPTPISNITASTLVGCPPLTILFQGDNSFNSWDFGNGNTSSLNINNQIYNVPGTYHVSLISEYANGCSDTDNVDVLIYPKPTSLFSQSIDSSCITPINVTFTNSSYGANGYSWLFGNGVTSNLNTNINVLFNNTGMFTNMLVASNQFGCVDTSYKSLLLYPRPVASASLSPSQGCEPLSVQFTNNSINTNNYLWSFGDGGFSTLPNPLYDYNLYGNYQASLIAYGNANCSDTINLSTIINVWPNPVAAFTYTKLNDPIDNSGRVQFINNSTYSNSYLWNFGDNTSDTSFNPIHRYLNYGEFEIYLYVENDYGCWDTTKQRVRISEFHGLFVSNAFSPDFGPDEVRTFKPKGIGIKKYHLYIYDTWGNQLWETDELLNGEPAVGWNGIDKNGNVMPQDTYVWKVEATFMDGTVWPGKTYDNGMTKRYGTVTLIR